MPSSFKVFLIWLPIFWGAFIVYSTCQGRIYSSSDFDKSLQWTPGYSVALLNQNDRVLEKFTKSAASGIHVRAVQALRKAPLSYRPFVQFGRVSVLSKSENIEREFFIEAKKRNKRNHYALRALVRLDGKVGNYDDAVGNLNILLGSKAIPIRIEDYHRALTLLSVDPNARKTVDEFLGRQVSWGKVYLLNQIEFMTDVNFMDVERSLKAFVNEGLDAKTYDELNAEYIQKLIQIGKIDEAFEYWSGISGVQKDAGTYSVYNPNFEKRPAIPPFNWLELDRPKYFSEIDQGGGLYVSYADSKVKSLTEQLLRLQPGAVYTLKVDAEWTYRKRQGMFFWIVTCLPSEEVISGIDLDDNNKLTSGGEHTFQVPLEGCLHQRLNLVAKSGQYSQRIWSRTNSLNITQMP